ncbi:hypothetical protein RND59_00555 [Vibrio ruber]|uniref:hypothetical protein n=1 Tax=Vibrio ruber TaxID=184755 RepID=UPI0028933866|nr:hypothetical protein [Vibrio ruber]WNJ95647.1 hypothetical protein RND59_00555 [Vibrio ruber]
MKNLELAAQKLILLIEGQYDDIIPSPWGMEEYNHYDDKYLQPLSEKEKIAVFKLAYQNIDTEHFNSIEQLISLAPSFKVKFYQEYFGILRNETSKKKKEILFKNIKNQISEWPIHDQQSLSTEEKKLITSLCKQYDLPLPFSIK